MPEVTAGSARGRTDFVPAGAETLIGLGMIALDGECGEFSLPTGTHLADPEIGQVRGALGIALDDATGYLVVAASRADQWPVSLGIRVDFLADLPPTGPVSVHSELIECTETGGTTRGIVTGPDGTVLALAVQRSHLIAHDGGGPATSFDALPPAPPGPIRASLGVTVDGPGVLSMPQTPWSSNVRGAVHGGVLIIGMELAAHSAAGDGLTTTSVDIAYLRPCDGVGGTRFVAAVVHRGRSVVVVDVEAVRADGRVGAVATVTLQR